MANSKLPERASLEYLKKLAKDRLQQLRREDPAAKLAAALLAVARDHGFPSWRALKAEVEQRQASNAASFFEACASGDVAALRGLLSNDPGVVRATKADRYGGTGLHMAATRGHLDAVRLLLEHGADPNARDSGDNAYPLHFAAGYGHIDIVRALLDAGGDVHGFGDVHRADVIGWATGWGSAGDVRWDVISLLLERGARHNIFSAITVGDLDLIQQLVEQNPDVLDRRMSRFEQGQTPLHFAISQKRYDILELLIGLGADLEAEDANGQTALAAAMLRGDREAMKRLHVAGATQLQPMTPVAGAGLANLANSIKKGVPMIHVPDIASTIEWYKSIGFKELGRYEDAGVVNFGMVSFGKAELMLNAGGERGPQRVSLWFYTDRVDDLYQALKARQMQAAQAELAGEPVDERGIEFVEEIYDAFYGAREFGIRDLNGYNLFFIQPSTSAPEIG